MTAVCVPLWSQYFPLSRVFQNQCSTISDTCQINKSMKEMCMVFVAGYDVSKIFNPAAGVFDFFTMFVFLQFMSV